LNYLFCVVLSGVIETCIPVLPRMGLRFCSDVEGVNAGGRFTDSPVPGRFEIYNDDESCGLVGCVILQGSYDRKEVARDEAGRAFATAVVHDGERFADGMERIDLFPESTCTFSRVL